MIILWRSHRSTSDSGEQALVLIREDTVRSAAVRTDTGDLIVAFERGSTLEVLVTSSGYESWALSLPNGAQVIALGGGELHVVPRDA
jgi:hypothetical protein